MDAPELEAWLQLAFVPGLGPVRLAELLATCGTASAALTSPAAVLRQVVGAEVATAISSGGNRAAATAALRWQEQANHSLLVSSDDGYPSLLREISDPPPVIFVTGNAALLRAPSLAIVGSRNGTAQGCANAEAFARTLADAGLTIVSGLALGIDAAAHRGGLAGAGRSVAVIGTGIDIVYPARNRALAHQLAEGGAIASEFPLGTRALAGHFPRRNRILAGLTLGCLVVEAALQSGSLITARLAAEQGRDVFALPGSIHSPLAKGCHRLIKDGAKLVDDARDILEELRLPSANAASVPAPATAETASGPDTELLAALGWEPCAIDTLAARTALAPAELHALLLALELSGDLATLPGGQVQRLQRKR